MNSFVCSFVSSFADLSQLDCAGLRNLECGREQGSWSSRWVYRFLDSVCALLDVDDDLGTDSRRSVCLHHFQQYRDVPLYLLVRVPPFVTQFSGLFMRDLQRFDGHGNFFFLDLDDRV
jgi:hypothetical protein